MIARRNRLASKYGWQFSFGWLLPVLLQSQPTVRDSRMEALLTYLPRLISAAILLVIAWSIATILRAAARKVLSLFSSSVRDSLQGETAKDKTAADKTTDETTTASSDRPVDFLIEADTASETNPELGNVSEIIANGIYWLVFLLALPAILSALNIL
ncbi:MAG: hypothetical protein ACFB0D_22350 [Phormidesmis sp.]